MTNSSKGRCRSLQSFACAFVAKQKVVPHTVLANATVVASWTQLLSSRAVA
jgi:hypothetical protein